MSICSGANANIFFDGLMSVHQNTSPKGGEVQFFRPDIAVSMPFPPDVAVKLTKNAMLTITLEVG